MANSAMYAPPDALSLRWWSEAQKVKLLIPGHIPGSFCEFRIVCLILSAFVTGGHCPHLPTGAGADLSFPGLRRLKHNTQDRAYHIGRKQVSRMRRIYFAKLRAAAPGRRPPE